MDMMFDLDGGAADPLQGATPQPGGHPSWPELLARMVAARQASVSLTREMQGTGAIGHGSFAGAAAPFVAAHAGTHGSVNLNDLGNCKPGEPTTLNVAGSTTPGGRGYT